MEKRKVLITSSLCFLVIFIYVFTSKVEVKNSIKDLNINKVHSNKHDIEVVGNGKKKENIQINGESQTNSNSSEKDINSINSDESEINTEKYKEGTHRGIGKGFKGDIEVEVKVEAGKIVGINIINSIDDEAYFDNAKNVIDKIIEAQDLDVDVVGGATYSSNGIIEAVKSALK